MVKIMYYDVYLENDKIYVKTTLGEIIELHRNENGLYTITLYGQKITKSYNWFYKFAEYKIVFTEQYSNYINLLEFKDYEPYGVAKKTSLNYIPVFNKPAEITYNNIIYRLLPIHPIYAIDCSGNIISLKDFKFINIRCDEVIKYKTCSIKGKTLFIHKLVALSWVNNDDYIKNNAVDHIDNNKLNNHYKNLQWCSISNNNTKRKYNNISDNVIARCIQTNEIFRFNSVKACYTQLNLPKINLKNRNLTLGKIWRNKEKTLSFEILFKVDFKEWYYPEINGEIIPKRGRVSCRETELYNLKTKKIYKNLSRKEIIKLLKITSISTFNNRLWKKDFTTPINGWLVKLDCNKSFTELEKEITIPKNLNIKIDLINASTFEIRTFRSIHELRKVIYLAYRTFHKYLETGKVFLYNNEKYYIKYHI